MQNAVLQGLSDGIASIRLNRPETLNAFDAELAEALLKAIHWATHSEARVIVLSGAGRAFCAGGDLRYLKNAGACPDAAIEALIHPMHAAVEALMRSPQPVIASVHGAVAGAGMSLALAADLAIAADDTVLTLAYVKIGATPDCGASWTLPRLLGVRRAMEIALLGDRIDALRAESLGLVNRVVPASKLEAETEHLARRLAEGAPFAMAGIKALLWASLERNLSEQLQAERQSFLAASQTPDFHEALAAFFDRRAPRFSAL